MFGDLIKGWVMVMDRGKTMRRHREKTAIYSQGEGLGEKSTP